MWYSPDKIMTHNALINMVIGPRGAGKTYGLKERAIKNWINKGERFVYLRRYDSELDKVKDTLFNDINLNSEYPPVTYKDGQYWMEEEMIGYAMPLSISNQLKSASYPDVTLIIFDEFIIDETQNQRYLKNEVRKLLDLIETIGRARENITCFMLANSLSFVNPYTIYWDMEYVEGQTIIKDKSKLVLVEIYTNVEFTDMKKKTRFGRLIEGTEYGNMSIGNKFILDTTDFIAKRPSSARYDFTLINEGVAYGVWRDYRTCMFYVDQKIDPSCLKVISGTLDDHTPNQLFLRGKNGFMGMFLKAFTLGQVRFVDQKTKKSMMNILKHLL